jgi:hypothetical protein
MCVSPTTPPRPAHVQCLCGGADAVVCGGGAELGVGVVGWFWGWERRGDGGGSDSGEDGGEFVFHSAGEAEPKGDYRECNSSYSYEDAYKVSVEEAEVLCFVGRWRGSCAKFTFRKPKETSTRAADATEGDQSLTLPIPTGTNVTQESASATTGSSTSSSTGEAAQTGVAMAVLG